MTPSLTLARWFQMERYANQPEDDFVREEILGEVNQAVAVAVHGKTTLVKTPNGACMIEAKDVQGCPLVEFDYVEDQRWTRTSFWMNASSVKDLGERLRTVPRADFDTIFLYGRAA